MASYVNAVDAYTALFIVTGAIWAYTVSRCVYLLHFHPLARFPGPKVAAVSNVWYAYHWLSGRYPWAIEKALHTYGDVVRIAPNELVFFTPQSFIDIYGPHHKNLEQFIKTDFQNRGKDLGGIVWEEDPNRHREVARKLSPAFSSRSIRNLEPTVHQYLDLFIAQMKDLGSEATGVPLAKWTNWLAMDTAADLAWSLEQHEMRDRIDSLHLDVLTRFNYFSTVLQVFKRFPLVRPLQYLFVPFKRLSLIADVERATRESVMRRVNQRGQTMRPDLFDHILAVDDSLPSDPRELRHMGSVALQVMFASWGPMADLYYAALVMLLHEPESYQLLTDEIRTHFASYEDIVASEVSSLQYLDACINETLRLLPSNLTGLPRISPGALVDGRYIAKGISVQSSLWALGRHPDYFHEARSFKPQRWLPSSNRLAQQDFKNDYLKGLHPFSLGPRKCVGRELSWVQGRLFLTKVLWCFDVLKVPGQNFDLESQLRHYGFFEKPELQVLFKPVQR